MRVLQLNMWARRGPYSERAPLLQREVGLLAPDVIALQEVAAVSADGRNQAEELFGPFGYHVAWMAGDGASAGLPGIALASREPLSDPREIRLPHDGVALAARTRADGHEVWVCSACPFGWKPGLEIEREREVVALDSALAEIAADADLPPILLGDFDATPDAASIRFLTGLQSLEARSTYWADAWAIAGDGSPGWTWSTDSPYVAPFAAAIFAEPEHHRRIDYVFVGSPIRWPPRIVIRDCKVVLREQGSVQASDHYGVLADLAIDAVAIAGGTGEARWDEAAEVLWGQPRER